MSKVNLVITHIATATAILNIDGVNLLTDPAFPSASLEFDAGITILKNPQVPALALADLPHIDGILLSHEDHVDNLDDVGRTLLEGRKVLTTMDGKKNLGSRPDIYGMKPWEARSVTFGGKEFKVTATPCQHLPGGECIGFILETDSFGTSADGLPNAIYFSGDTVYIEELKEISKKVHVMVAILNLGAACVPLPTGPLQITMDGKQAAQLMKDIKADLIVPMHFESWSHFTQKKDALFKSFEEEGVADKVCWLVPGQPKRVL